MRQPLVIGNWKMNGSRDSIAALLTGIQSADSGITEVAVCPPHAYLALVADQLKGSDIKLGAQDVSHQTAGAHTGDVAAEMLVDIGCEFVIVGHSERRADHNESNEQAAEKYTRAQQADLQAVLCVGESLQQREAGLTLDIIGEQLNAVIGSVKTPPAMIIAYEPVWAIGTGKTATVEQAQEVHAFIREQLGLNGNKSRILYGGSVKPENAKALFEQPDIDGGLIGGASLEAESFLAICNAV